MRKIVVLLSVFAFMTSISYAQDEAMMKAWEEYKTPGEMHKMMERSVGEWTADITMWMDPTQPPTKSEGVSVVESILGGRYFQTKHTGDFMGMQMNGIELSGYDNAKKKFFSTWIDNFGTGIMYLEGTYDAASKTIHLSGTSVDPMGNEVKVREIITLIDEDNTMFEMFMGEGDQEFKSMEIKFTRKS